MTHRELQYALDIALANAEAAFDQRHDDQYLDVRQSYLENMGDSLSENGLRDYMPEAIEAFNARADQLFAAR